MSRAAGHDAAGLDLARSGQRRGVVILAVFGVAWGLVGASGLPAGPGWVLRIAAALVAAGAVVVALRPVPAGRVAREAHLPDGWRRGVGLVNGGQFVAIALVVAVFLLLGRPEFVPPLVCLVVGLHFFPLARLFDQPEYTPTAAVLCAVACAGLVVLLAGPGAAPSRVVVGAGAALTLLGTAWYLALRRS
ncbi:hypothetical protein [Pseudonocardia sp. MH-G8]|uniref:DUF7010 family protein n=1 Tax=Pseudonocardia sp. MH-G8 TaxID=1854588 RepID=UPI000BA015E6|nr:hypothetical protein [Pseudonocardia sp. MH-G8]OZM81500.1 hypothetical protein CFP66_15300 [Pseudonocardia sp. MH-G8]